MAGSFPAVPPPTKDYLKRKAAQLPSDADLETGRRGVERDALYYNQAVHTTSDVVTGLRSFQGSLSSANIFCSAKAFLLMFLALLTFWVPLAVLVPLAALTLPVVTFLILTFGTMHKQWGDPYWGFILWIQKVRIVSQFMQFGGVRIEGRSAYRVSLMRPKGPLKKSPLPLGWGLMTADYTEEEMDGAVILGNLFGTRFSTELIPVPWLLECWRQLTISFPLREQLTSFACGEDPVDYVMQEVAAIYPELHEVWPEKLSDDALAHFARSGLGAHRVELAPRNAFGARYVVRTNALAVLEVREGFATYGGDAYFDAGWRPVAIVRAAPAAGQARSEDWYKPLVETVYRPGDGIAWEYAKFCFRASVFCLVTFVDRKGEDLFVLHMQVSELTTLACREQLSPEHPIRRFLVPFTFGAITINAWARTALCAYRSTVGRAFAFTDRSLARAWVLAPVLAQTRGEVSWLEHGKRLAAAGSVAADKDIAVAELEAAVRVAEMSESDQNWIDEFVLHHGSPFHSHGVDTPFFRNAERFHGIVDSWVRGYVTHYYPAGVSEAEDAELYAFVKQIIQTTFGSTEDALGLSMRGALAAARGRPMRMRDLLICFLTRYIENVTLGHEQAGAVAVYAQDASWVCFSWKEGDACGTKEAAMMTATLMCLTSSITPTLMPQRSSSFEQHDWAFLYPSAGGECSEEASALREMNRKFQLDLAAMASDLDQYCEDAPSRPFPDNIGIWSVNPRYMEASVSI